MDTNTSLIDNLEEDEEKKFMYEIIEGTANIIRNLYLKIDKVEDELITLIQIIGEQPSQNVEEDNWLLGRLESICNILKGDENER